MEDIMSNDYFTESWKEAWIEGWKKGWTEGWKEAKALEKQETAIRLLKRGTSIDLIQIATELPIAAINDIAKSLKLPIVA